MAYGGGKDGLPLAMMTESLEGIGHHDANLEFTGNYSFPFLKLEVVSNSARALRYLDFFLEPFRSPSLEFSQGFRLAFLVDDAALVSNNGHIFDEKDDLQTKRVCYGSVSAHIVSKGGIRYFKASDGVFGAISTNDRYCLIILRQDYLYSQRAHFLGIFIFVLTEILAGQNCVLLHAASFANEKGGFCIAGLSGAGKTTHLLGLLKTGRYQFLGDEWCVIQLTNEGWRAGALTPKVCVPAQSIPYFEELCGYRNSITYSSERKWYVDPRRIYGNCFKTSCTPMGIVFLENTEGVSPGIEPIGTFDALNKMVKNVFVPLVHEDFLSNLDITNKFIQHSKLFRLIRSPVLEESVRLIDSVAGSL